MATNNGNESMKQTPSSSKTEPPFWRRPAAAAAVSSFSPEMTLAITPPALTSGSTYSTAIVEALASSAAVAVPVLPTAAIEQQQPPLASAAAAAAAATCQFCRLSNGSISAATATSLGASGPRWTDRRNLTEVQEEELQGKIRNLILECEQKQHGFLSTCGNKKKLLLEGMSLTEADIPVEDILLGVDYRDKYKSSTTVAPQWIKAAKAASKNKASKGDSHGTQATTASSVMNSAPEGGGRSGGRVFKKSGSGSSAISNGSSINSSSQNRASPLTKSLHTLSLARNRYLVTIPQKLVSGSMVSGAKLAHLKLLDLSSCAIHKLPDERMWDLPQLQTLNLAFNRLHDFPNQNVLGGLPQLKELNLYGNRLSEICHFRQGCGVGSRNNNSKLVLLNVAYNDLMCLPETLPFPRLQSLIASHNFLTVIPQALVLSLPSSSTRYNTKNNKPPRLRHLDVTSNPVAEPPVEVCERGLHEMRRYYMMHPQQQDSSSRRAKAAAGGGGSTALRRSSRPPMNSLEFDRHRLAAAARRRSTEASSSSMYPLFDLVGGQLDGDDDDDDDRLGGGHEQQEPLDVNAVFQQQFQHSLQPGLLSRRPSNEVPLFISVASTSATS